MIFGFLLCTVCWVLGSCNNYPERTMHTVFEWNNFEYSFPTEKDRKYAIENKMYSEEFKRPADVDFLHGDDGRTRVFITTPRLAATGVPYTLATVTNVRGKYGPLLKAYPNYTMHSSHGQDCSGITSAFRIFIDDCEKLWVVDTGRIGSDRHSQKCPPKLVIFDLRTDKIIHEHIFDKSLYIDGLSMFNHPVLDVLNPPPIGNCEKAKLYVTDTRGHSLIVYDRETDDAWRIGNKYFHPDPDFVTVTVANQSYEFSDGIYSVAFTPNNGKNLDSRKLYFHAHASEYELSVPMTLLNNKTIWKQNAEAFPNEFKVLGARGTQSSASVIDSKGNLFGGLIDPISIYMWDIRTSYNWKNFKIFYNPEKLQSLSGLKIIKNRKGEEILWGISYRGQKMSTNTMTLDEINFRVVRCSTRAMLDGISKCT